MKNNFKLKCSVTLNKYISMSIPFENTNYNSGGGGSTLGAGTGINVDNNTITNTAPDQTVVLEPGTGINITGSYPEFTIINTLPNQQSNFTQTNASAVSFISNKPIITTSSSVTSVGQLTGANAEGNHTAFGKNSAKQALQGHLCLGEESGEQGGSRAISIGYRAHATNAGSTVISSSDSTLSSSANDAFFMEKLRTVDPNSLNVSHMKINMYNTDTKEIFNVDNLLVPGTCKINGAVQFGSTAKISINSAGAIGFGSTPQFGISGTVLLSGAATGTPAWGVLDYSSLTGRPTALSSGTGISIVNNAITNTLPNVNGDFTQATSSNSAFILNKPIITTSSSVTSVGEGVGANAEGNHTAFGKLSAKQAMAGHLCLGEESGEQGGSRAISIGYRAHATNAGSTVISSGGTALSSSANDAFFMEKLRTVDPLQQTLSYMKINMYNTSTKEIFNVDNLLVPGICLINGETHINNTLNILDGKIRVNAAGAIGLNNSFGSAGQYLRSGTANASPTWATLPTSLSSNDTVTFNGLTIGNAAGTASNTSIININHTINTGASAAIAQVSGVIQGNAGGQFVVSTATAAGTLTERLRISNVGGYSFGGNIPNYGGAGTVLTAPGNLGAPTWEALPAIPVIAARCYGSAYGYLSNPSQNSMVTITNFADYGGFSPVGVARTANGFTIQTAGIYRISYNIQATRGSNIYFHFTYLTTRITKGSAVIFTKSFAGTAASGPPYFTSMCNDVNQMFSLSANDTIGFQSQNDSPAAGGALTTCHVNIEKVNI